MVLAVAVAGAGAIAAVLANQHIAATHQEPGPVHAVRSLGVLALILGPLAALNFLYALVLMRRMERGEDVLGRWAVPPDEYDRFLQAERSRKVRKNNWRVLRRAPPGGVPVIFTRDAVLVGKSWFRLRSKGMSRFTNARIDTDPVTTIEFAMTLRIIGAGTQSTTARYRGHLRVPVANNAHVEAARVAGYFRGLL